LGDRKFRLRVPELGKVHTRIGSFFEKKKPGRCPKRSRTKREKQEYLKHDGEGGEPGPNSVARLGCFSLSAVAQKGRRKYQTVEKEWGACGESASVGRSGNAGKKENIGTRKPTKRGRRWKGPRSLVLEPRVGKGRPGKRVVGRSKRGCFLRKGLVADLCFGFRMRSEKQGDRVRARGQENGDQGDGGTFFGCAPVERTRKRP